MSFEKGVAIKPDGPLGRTRNTEVTGHLKQQSLARREHEPPKACARSDSCAARH